MHRDGASVVVPVGQLLRLVGGYYSSSTDGIGGRADDDGDNDSDNDDTNLNDGAETNFELEEAEQAQAGYPEATGRRNFTGKLKRQRPGSGTRVGRPSRWHSRAAPTLKCCSSYTSNDHGILRL